MRVSPPVAIAVVVIALVVAVIVVWKGSSASRFPPPPPMQSGLPAGAAPTGKTSGGADGSRPLTPGAQLPLPGTPPAGQ